MKNVIFLLLAHIGGLGLKQHPINAFRLMGCAGLLTSLYLIQSPVEKEK